MNSARTQTPAVGAPRSPMAAPVDAGAVIASGRALLSRCGSADAVRCDGRLPAECRSWLDGVRRAAGSLSPGQIVPVMHVYDVMYRVVHRCPPPADFLDRCYARAFEACVKGDRSVSEPALYAVIDARLDRISGRTRDRYLNWIGATLARWYKESLDADRWMSLPLRETIGRTCCLLAADLFMFCSDSDAYKRRLATLLLPALDRHLLPAATSVRPDASAAVSASARPAATDILDAPTLDAMAGFITLVEGTLLSPQRASSLRAALTRLTEKQQSVTSD